MRQGVHFQDRERIVPNNHVHPGVVSATHGRTNAAGGGHVLDPRSGESLERDGLVAVVDTCPRRAELWSTALLVLGRLPEGSPELDVLFGEGPAGGRRYSLRGRSPADSAFTVPPTATLR